MKAFLKYILIIVIFSFQVYDVSAVNETAIQIPGTRISCIPPSDFSLSKGFVGLESMKYQASILFMELPWPPTLNVKQFAPFIKNQFNPKALAAKGVKLRNTEQITIGANNGIILKTSQLANSIEYTKWIILIEKENKAIYQIQITSPSNHFITIEKEIDNLIESIEINTKEYEVELSYSISLPNGWRLAKQHGIMELYTETGKFPKSSPNESSLAVMNLQEYVRVQDRADWVKLKNTKRNYFSNFNTVSSHDLTINGFKANISVVDCYSDSAKKNVTKLYCYIFLNDTTFLIETDEHSIININTFFKICESWRLKG